MKLEGKIRANKYRGNEYWFETEDGRTLHFLAGKRVIKELDDLIKTAPVIHNEWRKLTVFFQVEGDFFKAEEPEKVAITQEAIPAPEVAPEEPAKRKRGRPKKVS